MMSHEFVPATSGLNASKNARVCAWVLNIFQFPAITGLRTNSPETPFWVRETAALAFFRKGFDSGKFFACQKFKRRATAGGNVTDLRRYARLLDRRNRISSTDN